MTFSSPQERTELNMQLRILHRTAYTYEEPVKYTAQALRLTPRREGSQRTLSWAIHAPGRRIEQLDAHGNITHLLTFEEPHREMSILVSGTVEISGTGEMLRHDGTLSPLAYLATTPLTAPNADMINLADENLSGDAPLRDRLYRLAGAVHDRVRYRKGATSVDDSAATALAAGHGVCQDQSHVFISCCRAARIPARYVSGYLCSQDGSDSASHAWVDAWIEESKAWLGIDITNLSAADAGHCRLAVGRDYLDAAPVRGIRRGGGREIMDVSVTATSFVGQ
ncbi:MAG TPA: transglutaminase family protein [Steroidobacteraceae bacterium]|jgi:transglutaminase-like putative cysteine protease